MKIALDYDNTYSADPVLWKAFAQMARAVGHDVRIVTARDERHDRTSPLIAVEQHFPVIYCRGVAKKWYLTHFHPDFPVDIWIDDKPESILTNSAFSPDGLAEWRATRDELSA